MQLATELFLVQRSCFFCALFAEQFFIIIRQPYYNKEKIGDNKQIILFCAAGSRSALSVKTLKDMGFENVAHVDGGFQSLQLSGFNIVEKEKE